MFKHMQIYIKNIKCNKKKQLNYDVHNFKCK